MVFHFCLRRQRLETHMSRPHIVAEMHDRMRLREALAAALAEAHHARAPERLLVLLQRAYQSLESSRFVDDDVIRWAEAGLGAWRRWATAPGRLAHRLLVVDRAGELA